MSANNDYGRTCYSSGVDENCVKHREDRCRRKIGGEPVCQHKRNEHTPECHSCGCVAFIENNDFPICESCGKRVTVSWENHEEECADTQETVSQKEK